MRQSARVTRCGFTDGDEVVSRPGHPRCHELVLDKNLVRQDDPEHPHEHHVRHGHRGDGIQRSLGDGTPWVGL